MAHSVEFKYETKNSDLFVALLCLTKIRKPSVGQGRYCEEPFVCKKNQQKKNPHLSLSAGLKNQFSKQEACINDDTSIQEKKKKKKKSRAFPKYIHTYEL